MKSVELPSRDDLRNALETLSWGEPDKILPENLVQWAHWARLDARLAETLVRFIAEFFRRINPFTLREINRKSPQPQALATLIDFALYRLRRNKVSADLEDFRAWSRFITKDIPPASPQMFFIREGAPRPESDRRKIERSLKPYRRWGYFGDESLAGTTPHSGNSTLLGKTERQIILDRLLSSHDSISVEDYIRACNGRIHRRTAQRDLRESVRLKGKGFTRNKRYKPVDR